MVTFPMTLSDLWPRFQGHGIIEGEYLYGFYRNHTQYPIYRMVPLSMTLSDLWPEFQGHYIFEVEYL